MLKIVIMVKHLLQTVSFSLGSGLLLYSFKSNQCLPANPQWRCGIGDGLETLSSGFDSYSRSSVFFSLKIEETYTFMIIS